MYLLFFLKIHRKGIKQSLNHFENIHHCTTNILHTNSNYNKSDDSGNSNNKIELENGTPITPELVTTFADEEVAKLGGDPSLYLVARDAFISVAVSDEYLDFLTLPAYARMP
jgi:hypothetical protein